MVQWYSMSRWCFLLGIRINSIFSLCTPGDVWGMFALLVVGVGIWSGAFRVLSRQKMVEWLQTVTSWIFSRERSNGLEWQVLWSSGHVTQSNTNWNITQNHINVMTSTGMVLSLVRNSPKPPSTSKYELWPNDFHRCPDVFLLKARISQRTNSQKTTPCTFYALEPK